MLNVKDRHAWSLGKSALLSRMYYMNALHPLDVIKVLNEGKISFVLAGAHGLAGWYMKPRSTEDVDVIVAKKHLRKATQLLCAAFPQLVVEDTAVVIRLRERDSQQVVIDLMKPLQTVYRETFKHTTEVQKGRISYRIPCLEMALVMKAVAMLSPYRAEADKYQDATDFIRMVETNDAAVNDAYLTELGELIFEGGGKRVLEMVTDVRNGKKLVI